MSRHPEPKIVTLYREAIKTPAPKVCATCEFYGNDGLCVEFFAEPPIEFASEPGSCELWEQEIPF